MKSGDCNIYIIGAGISGLVAAKTLEKRGFSPVILEATDRPGGRVKTDTIDGVHFDRGFQVLLTAYPEAQKHLDFGKLDLRGFSPGALIFSKGTAQRIGDPLRDPSTLWATMLSSVGTIGDKWKTFQLSRTLKRKTLSEIFDRKEQTTLSYLRERGFSERIINTFYKPFFTGIFLEDELRTPSCMFEFTFKMFSEGFAAIPDTGIGAISQHLANALERTQIHYNKRVDKVTQNAVYLEGGEVLKSDASLVTVPMDDPSGEVRPSLIRWKRCDNLYFSVENRSFPEGIIALVAEHDSLVNNLHFPSGQSLSGRPLLSVTVVKRHGLEQGALVDRVQEELERLCGIRTHAFLRHYAIEQALPDVQVPRLLPADPASPVLTNVFRSGDYLANASLNAAMASGEAAANALADWLVS